MTKKNKSIERVRNNTTVMNDSNLNNQQQANVLKSQQDQQRLLSNQAADNAASQFNATSENQTKQLFAELDTQISQCNACRDRGCLN